MPGQKVIAVDMWRGPIGGYGFRAGMWTATLESGKKFKFYGSIPHVDGMNEERMILSAQQSLDNNLKSIEWL
jgi:hypothetical protein